MHSKRDQQPDSNDNPRMDPVTFGFFGVLGGTCAFIWIEQAALFVSMGLVLGLTFPVRLSRWIHW